MSLRADFVQIETEIGMTMVNLAHTERLIRDFEGASTAIANARKALEIAERFSGVLRSDSEVLANLNERIENLRAAIKQFVQRAG